MKEEADKQNEEEVSERSINIRCAISIAIISSITTWITTLGVQQDKPLFLAAGIYGVIITIIAIWLSVKST